MKRSPQEQRSSNGVASPSAPPSGPSSFTVDPRRNGPSDGGPGRSLIQNVAFDGVMRGGGIELDEDLLRHYHDAGTLSSFRFERFRATSH